ncbi:GPA2 [Candida margitis]|uniref:GPA2 n=1 Tax=Candida margitis TaxID=1775924 RepID=UPI002226FD8D|nr:GPA2 [Candida margitis]KAI5969058.1 GPA2 [Candida margitis]
MGSCTSKDTSQVNNTSKPAISTQAKRQEQTQAVNKKQQTSQQSQQPQSSSLHPSQQHQHQQHQQHSTGSISDHEKSNNSTLDNNGQSAFGSANEKQMGSSNGVTNGTETTINGGNGTMDQAMNPVDAAAKSNTEHEVKVLLLGSGESGKSTIVKQMKILHQNGYTQEELYEYKPFIYKNVMDCIKNVINAIIDLDPELIKPKGEDGIDGTATTTSDAQDQTEVVNGTWRKHVLDYDSLNEVLDYEILLDGSNDAVFDQSIAEKIEQIYNTPEVRDFMIHKQGQFYLIDSTEYFMTNLKRIAQPDYIPSTTDVLRTRKKTSGIFDFTFDMGNNFHIHMFDVGGQRSERKKWIHCFDNVTLIIFCVSLSEYDQVLLEENNQNRLEESIALFDSVVNSRWFARTSVVLFLNKIDVFAEKLQYSPLETHFPDYTGGNNINKAAKYILWRFNQVNRSGLNIYPHVTQATDTSNIQLVMAAVKETIMENTLKDSGLI